MAPISLSPIGKGPWRNGAKGRRRGMVRRLFRGVKWVAATPVQWLGMKPIRDGATLVSGLAGRVRARPNRDPRFRTGDDGRFDRRATAFSYGVSEQELEDRLRSRQRQPAIAAFGLFGLGVLFFAAWMLRVLGTAGAGARLLLAIDFLPFCLLFVLLGFCQSLINFQIRIGRSAGWREYLTTEAGFWPRP